MNKTNQNFTSPQAEMVQPRRWSGVFIGGLIVGLIAVGAFAFASQRGMITHNLGATTDMAAAPQPTAPTPAVATPTAPVAPSSAAPSAQIAIVDDITGEVKVLRQHEIDAIAQLIRPAAVPQPAPAPAPAPEPEVTQAAVTPLTPIRPAPEPEQETPVAVVQDETPSCRDALVALANNSTLFFDSGVVTLTPSQLQKLRGVGTAASLCPEARLKIRGHSDANGDEAANIAVSWQRADNVVAAMKEMGFDTSNILTVGFGSRRLVEDGSSSGENDRRVVIQVLPEGY